MGAGALSRQKTGSPVTRDKNQPAERPLSSCPVMDDPPSARANNTELIRDVFGDYISRRCFPYLPFISRTIEKPNFLPDFSFFSPPPPIGCPTSACRCASVIGPIAWRSSDRTRDVPETCYRTAMTKREIKLKCRGELRELSG